MISREEALRIDAELRGAVANYRDAAAELRRRERGLGVVTRERLEQIATGVGESGDE